MFLKPNKMSVAKRLKLLKERLGLSIAEFAEMVGTTKANLSSYMRGLALPPEKIVDNISKVSNVSKEWIYKGDLSEQIEDYIKNLGHEKFLEDYPECIDVIRIEAENLSRKKNINIDEKVISYFYDDFYGLKFRDYIRKLLIKNGYESEVDKIPIYGIQELNWNSFFEKVMEAIYKNEEKIVYKDDEKILSVAGRVLRRQINIFDRTKYGNLPSLFERVIDVDDYLEYLIRELKSSEGTKELILTICKQYIGSHDVNSERFQKTVEVFQSMVNELEEIQKDFKKTTK